MKFKDMVNEAVNSGIPPISLAYDVIHFLEGDKKLVRSFMEIESLDVGHLTYKEYRFIARRTKLGNAMIERHIEKLFRVYPKLITKDVLCITIPVYARLLMGGVLAGILFDALSCFEEVKPSAICIELSADVLYEDMQEAKLRIDELREMGFKVAICEVGDEFCPVFRLAEIAFDYAFVDQYVINSLSREDVERVAGSVVKFLHFVGVKVIAPDLETDAQLAGAKFAGFDGYGYKSPAPNFLEGGDNE